MSQSISRAWYLCSPSPIANRVARCSTVELVSPPCPLVIIWILMWVRSQRRYWICLLLAVPPLASSCAFFMINTNCATDHSSAVVSANDWVGRVIGVLTLTPYDFWRRSHAIHHANSGNLDHRGFGDVDMLTVREYLAAPRWASAPYPVVSASGRDVRPLGPAYLFILRHRLPVGLMRSSWPVSG